MFSKGNLREEMTTDDADLTGIFRSRGNGRNSGNDERVRTKLYLYRLCRARRRKTKSNRRERRVHTENYVSRRILFILLIMIFCPAEMAEMAEILLSTWKFYPLI